MKYIILISLHLSGCVLVNYGTSSECNIETYRRTDGSMNYYTTGSNCDNNVYRRLEDLNGKH